jgi:hypothetical protein
MLSIPFIVSVMLPRKQPSLFDAGQSSGALRARRPARAFLAIESADGTKVYAETSAEARSIRL